MTHPLVDQLLVPFILRLFVVFGIAGFALGAGLACYPERMHRYSALLDRWVSLRRSTRWLAIPRDAGPLVRRFRRSIGAAFIGLAAFSTYVLMTQTDVGRVAAALHFPLPAAVVAWLIESLRWLLVAGGLAAIVVGSLLAFFPQLLSAIELRVNHWYSLRCYGRSADTMHMGFDRWIERYPRATGWMIAAASLAVAVEFGLRLSGRS